MLLNQKMLDLTLTRNRMQLNESKLIVLNCDELSRMLFKIINSIKQ
jgi:hypothetical protein